MSVRSTTLKNNSELVIYGQLYETETYKGNLCFRDYKKAARIFSPLLKEPIDVFYHEYQAVTESGFGDVVKIEVLNPIKFEVIERGLNAQSRCEQAFRVAIVRVFSEKSPLLF